MAVCSEKIAPGNSDCSTRGAANRQCCRRPISGPSGFGRFIAHRASSRLALARCTLLAKRWQLSVGRQKKWRLSVPLNWLAHRAAGPIARDRNTRYQA
jgi:hypothetical protein